MECLNKLTYEVKSTVQAAVECRDIDVVGEFPVQQLEHAVSVLAGIKKVGPGTNVFAVLSLGYESERQLVAGDGTAISA